jgi:hypothetical protein
LKDEEKLIMLMQDEIYLSKKMKDDFNLSRRLELAYHIHDIHNEICKIRQKRIQMFREQEKRDWNAYLSAKPHGHRRFYKRGLYDKRVC